MADSKKSEKIKRIMDNYGISYESAEYIVTTPEDDLTFEELKMKLDNPNIGVLPDWISEQNLSFMIKKSIRCFKPQIDYLAISEEDIYQDVQLFVRKKSNRLVNYNCLKAIISNRIRTYIGKEQRVKDYIPHSLDRPIDITKGQNTFREYFQSVDDTLMAYDGECIYAKDPTISELEVLDLIASIKDNDLRDILIVTGYLLCDIEILKDMYLDMYNKKRPSIKSKLDALAEKIRYNMLLELDDVVIDGKKLRKKPVSFISVLASLNLDKIKNSISDDKQLSYIANEIRYYLKAGNIIKL